MQRFSKYWGDVSRGGLGLKAGPATFQMTLHPTGPARAKSLKTSEITFFPCKNGSMASPPLDVSIGRLPPKTLGDRPPVPPKSPPMSRSKGSLSRARLYARLSSPRLLWRRDECCVLKSFGRQKTLERHLYASTNRWPPTEPEPGLMKVVGDDWV